MFADQFKLQADKWEVVGMTVKRHKDAQWQTTDLWNFDSMILNSYENMIGMGDHRMNQSAEICH